MRLLLDTHIFIGLARQTLRDAYPHFSRVILLHESETFVSVASIWEIAIKTRLAKLDAGLPPSKITEFCVDLGIQVLPILADHATADIDPEPETRDPFDRMLLSQCKVEGLQLVTIDRALVNHPLALRV